MVPQRKKIRVNSITWVRELVLTSPAVITEKDLQEAVLTLASEYGVLYYHCLDSRPTVGKGFPDTVLCSPSATIFVELKVEDERRGYLKPDQIVWRDNLLSSGITWYLWRPSDLLSGEIERVIRRMVEDD